MASRKFYLAKVKSLAKWRALLKKIPDLDRVGFEREVCANDGFCDTYQKPYTGRVAPLRSCTRCPAQAWCQTGNSYEWQGRMDSVFNMHNSHWRRSAKRMVNWITREIEGTEE